jgi:hypothetical protein
MEEVKSSWGLWMSETTASTALVSVEAEGVLVPAGA